MRHRQPLSIICAAAIAFAWAAKAAAQAAAQLPPDNIPGVDPAKLEAQEAVKRVETGGLASWLELDLTKMILLFALLALLLLYLLVRLERGTPFVLRIYVITILIFGSLLIVSSAYTTGQIAPVIGFFGTIAGYLLGRGDRPSDSR
jgi:hypothetical protein